MKKTEDSTSGVRGELGFGGKSYSSDQLKFLQKHVINLARGKLASSGKFASDSSTVRALFEVHLPAALKEAKKKNRKLRLLFWAHGGLVSEGAALEHVLDYGPIWEQAGIYPIYFVWETGLFESFRSIMKGDDTRGFITDPILETVLRKPATAVWREIKDFARIASDSSGGAHGVAKLLRAFHATAKDEVELYACGHSAGSIFHARWLPLLAAAEIPVAELFLLAPAITVDLFAATLENLIGSQKPIQHCSMFTMFDSSERKDNVITIYRKSLLYFVSNACEESRQEPILGMEEFLRTDRGMHAFWGLNSARPATGELIFSPTQTLAGVRASNSTTHGGFDNDPATLNSLARRITGDSRTTPFTKENTRGMFADEWLADALPERAAETREAASAPKKLKVLKPKICLRHGSIDATLTSFPRGMPAVDHRATGHYEAVEPASAELVLDRWVSKLGAGDEREPVVTGMTRRGTMGGALGQTTILSRGKGGSAVFLGLGKYGGLGPAELATAVRELCLQISQLHGRHLVSVLIGSGMGNMSLSAAVDAWLRGIHQAQAIPGFSIKQITFVEFDAERFLELDAVIPRSLAGYQQGFLQVNDKEYAAALKQAASRSQERMTAKLRKLNQAHQARNKGVPVSTAPSAATAGSDPVSRITVRLEQEAYCFAALTDDAAVPERIVRIDPRIIDEIAGEIAATSDPAELVEWGRTLQKMLIPRDLHSRLFGSAAHVVMTLDATTARIPWEMLAIPGMPDLSAVTDPPFMGLAGGFGVTRQLQTGFASLPERQAAGKKRLSVIIVSDPAEDASLPGAIREGEFVEAFFRQNVPESELLLTHLKGPEATRAHLANKLSNHGYDVLHFAGHCYFNREYPGKSGWIFRANPLQVFSADEMLRIDRVPPFIVSNACESGVTPDRAREMNLSIGPAFAESFFARGVTNFVCTGWPVNDGAALHFTRTFYQILLAQGTIKDAMLAARREAWGIDFKTAGAYHHYGNPHFRLSSG